MPPVAVRILHPQPADDDGPLTAWLGAARAEAAAAHERGFAAVGATDVSIVGETFAGGSFGARVRAIVGSLEPGAGLVVLGSGSIPLATAADRRAFVEVAASGERRALANNRYSADIVAIGRVGDLPRVPDLPSDNALPRWLDEVAGYRVDDLRRRWRLGFDLDSPLDVVLLGRARRDHRALEAPSGVDLGPLTARLDAVARVAADRRAELLVAGRTSASALRWLERATACRVRALVEERGLRAASPLAMEGRPPRARPPRSLLGALLDHDGPAAIGQVVGDLAAAALLDSRVLLAHRLGPDEATWPTPEDRFASDLLLAKRIEDPWLAALTRAARDEPIPILLGGHTLVGPGLRLVLGAAGRRGQPGS